MQVIEARVSTLITLNFEDEYRSVMEALTRWAIDTDNLDEQIFLRDLMIQLEGANRKKDVKIIFT